MKCVRTEEEIAAAWDLARKNEDESDNAAGAYAMIQYLTGGTDWESLRAEIGDDE